MPPALREKILSAPPNPFRFLDLPGELRNHIYRHALVSANTFTIKLQFPSTDTSLLRVNKQILAEASTIFYQENIFWFPQPLFVGAPIISQLESFYHLSKKNLQMMKNFVLDIPVSACFENGYWKKRQVLLTSTLGIWAKYRRNIARTNSFKLLRVHLVSDEP